MINNLLYTLYDADTDNQQLKLATTDLLLQWLG